MKSKFKLKVGLLLIFITSCSQSSPQFAVLLWSPNSSLPENVVYEIQEEKVENQKNLILIKAPNNNAQWVEKWRVEVFSSLEEAKARALIPTEELMTIAVGARLWVKPEPYDSIITTLGKGILVRVIQRKEKDIANPVHWVEAISETGFRGWIPSYMLGSPSTSSTIRSLASLLDAGPWRPLSLKDMIESKRISITLLQSDLGFYLDPIEGTIKIITYQENQTVQENFKITKISETANDLGEFFVEGNIPLKIVWVNDNFLRVIIPRGTNETQVEFFSFKSLNSEKISEIITEELAKRLEYRNQLMNISKRWRSVTYGTLIFNDEGMDSWEGMDRLIPYLMQFLEDEYNKIKSENTDLNLSYADEGIDNNQNVLDKYRSWFGSVTHGGYQQTQDPTYVWAGKIQFNIYAPLPPRTLPIVSNSGYPMGALFYLEDDAPPLPFAIGFDGEGGMVKGLVLIPLPALKLSAEGSITEELPKNPVVIYFTPDY